MEVLLTGFEKFDDVINESIEAVNLVNAKVIKRCIPVSFNRAFFSIEQVIKEKKIDYLISLGIASKRNHVTIEKQAKNYMDARIMDNDLCKPQGIIDQNAPEILETNAPIERIKRIFDEFTPSLISEDCGGFVCNRLYYDELKNAGKWGYKAIFIHIPKNNVVSIECVSRALEKLISELEE